MIKDLELIKKLTVKDFDHFQDRVSQLDESVDPIFGGHLLALRGQKWRDMRSTLSPVFTSSKMRGMFEFIEESAQQTLSYFKTNIQNAKNNVFEVEMKDVYRKFINDAIASSAFGLSVNSFEDPENPFYRIGIKAIDFTGIRLFKFFFAASSPKLFNALGIQMIDPAINDFYRKLYKDTTEDRIKNNRIRTDVIHLLMEAKKGYLQHESQSDDKDTGFSTVEESSIGKSTHKRKWTDDELTAQAVLFLLAGFDTQASALSFMTHELTVNQEIQKKLQEEIDQVFNENNGKVTYTALNNMVYMDMVVSETLRKWPPLPMVDRRCVKPFLLPPPDNISTKRFQVEVGQGIQIPIYSIHRDPEYYQDPEKFDPERFSEENKHKIKPQSYLPFGIGPRNCIGSRFALMETKIIIFYLLKHFDFVSTPKTENPLKIQINSFALMAKNGFWIGFKNRDKKEI